MALRTGKFSQVAISGEVLHVSGDPSEFGDGSGPQRTTELPVQASLLEKPQFHHVDAPHPWPLLSLITSPKAHLQKSDQASTLLMLLNGDEGQLDSCVGTFKP